jgi:transposase-like protein
MSDGSVEEKHATKIEMWRERIAEHGCSGLSVKEFCKERGLTAWSFYSWRKRLREAGPVRFALIERGPVRQESALDAQLELVLGSGERLRIGAGVEAATLRLVLEALRG